MIVLLKMKNFRRLALIHLLLGGIGKQIGFHPESMDLSNQAVFNRLILILQSGMTMRLIRRLVCSRADPFVERTLRRGIRMVYNPILSLETPDSSFSLLMRFKASFPINKIEVLDCIGPQVNLQLSTVSTHCDIGSKRSLVDQMLLTVDIQSSKLLSEKIRRVPPESFPMSARRGAYFACGDISRGVLCVEYSERIRRGIFAHSSGITAFAFHPSLPLLATYAGEDKLVKMWYIPSELASIPVLITSIHTPGSMGFSLAFHRELPIVFIGKKDGSLEIWGAF